MAEQVLKLLITGNVSGATKAMRDMQRELDRTTKNLNHLGNTLTLGVTLPIVAAGTAAVKLAADAQTTERLFNTAFGEMGADARKWSEDFSRSLGLNSYEVREFAGRFQLMFDGMGLGMQQGEKMSETLVGLAYDFKALRKDMSMEDIFKKLMSGVAGQTRGLKQLGIVTDNAAIQQYAYTHGIAQQGATLTATQKSLAIYGIIIQQTKAIQGSWAAAMGDPNIMLMVLGNRAKDLAISFGTLLLPKTLELIDGLTGLVDWLNSLDQGTKQAIIVTAGLAAAIGPAVKIAAGLSWTLGQLHKVYMAYNATAKVSAAVTAANHAEMVSFAQFLGTGALITGVVALGYAWEQTEQAMNRYLANQIAGRNVVKDELDWLAKKGAVAQWVASGLAWLNHVELQGAQQKPQTLASIQKEIAATLQEADATAEATQEQQNLTRALDGRKVAEDSVAGRTRSLAEAEIARNRANRAATQAQDALNQAIKEHGRNSDEAKAATDDLREAQMRAKDAQADYNDAVKNLSTANAVNELDNLRRAFNDAADAARNAKKALSGAGITTGSSAAHQGLLQAEGSILKARPGGYHVTAAEAGSDEAFIPINSKPRSYALLAETMRRMGVGGPSFSFAGAVFQVNVPDGRVPTFKRELASALGAPVVAPA